MENLAVLQGFGTKKPKLIGYYRPSFLTTRIARSPETVRVLRLACETHIAQIGRIARTRKTVRVLRLAL